MRQIIETNWKELLLPLHDDIDTTWQVFTGFPLVLKSLEKCLNFTYSNSRPLKVLKNDNGA